MPDLLVRLYDIPPLSPALEQQSAKGVRIIRAMASDKHEVMAWTSSHFGIGWASEVDVAFSRLPISCFIAVHNNKVIGVACHESTGRGFFGPTGVDPEYRGRAIGTALLLACLHDMHNQGYAYAIIGAAGPVAYYQKAVGAIIIPNSEPGIYANVITPWG